MSSDNGYIVGPLDPDGEEWGVWPFAMSSGLDAEEQDPTSTHPNQSDALDAAYELDDEWGSEYGVSIINEWPVKQEGF